MSTSTIVKLGGVELSAIAPYGWSFTPGGRPHMRVFEVSVRAAESLRSQLGGFVKLEIDAPPRPKLVVEKLFLVDIRAGTSAFTRGVLVADQRYLWRRKIIVRDFNMARKTGNVRLAGEGIRVENQRLVPEIQYTPGSLDSVGAPYTAETALKSVLDELVGPTGGIKIPSIARKIVIQDLTLNDPGDEAVSKMLAYLAGISLWVDENGDVRVFDMRDRSELLTLLGAGPPFRGAGFHGQADRAKTRPSKIHVLFERECELRFDYEEGATPTYVRGREPRTLENVIPQPDISLKLTSGETVGRGTYLEYSAWFAALAALGDQARTPGGKIGALSNTILCKYYLGMWGYMVNNLYGVTLQGQVDAVWKKRLSAARASWRKLFRLTPKWRDKIRSLRAYRVAMLDPTTGTMAPAEAYMQYIGMPSKAALPKVTMQNPDVGHQVSGWATLLKDGTAAPAAVTVIDEVGGIFRVDLQADPFGETDALAPGNVANLPTHKVSGNVKDATGKVYLLWAAAPLLPSWKCAVVITAMQSVPNNSGRYHRVSVEPKVGGEVLGIPLGKCEGPELELYVPAGLQTARFMWDDNYASMYDECFATGAALPDTLLVNKYEVESIANAMAAREWGSFVDREEGSIVVALNPEVKLTGAIASVEHSVAVSGVATTSIIVAPEMHQVDLMAFIPASVQRVIRRYVQ